MSTTKIKQILQLQLPAEEMFASTQWTWLL